MFVLPGTAAQVRDLPDFAPLVAKQAPVVVNITATQSSRVASPLQHLGEDVPMPDWLRRFAPKGSEQQPLPDDDNESTGSGFIIGADGYILTNSHVVEAADEILVRLSDRREFAARVIGRDKRSDIALLKVDAIGLPVARFGNPALLRVGDWVLAIGSPFGFESSVTAGIVSAKGRSLPDETLVPFIQTDVAINPGNSGGPLFNLKGEVVGINSQIYSRSGGFMGISFSIPIDVALDVQQQLRQYGRVRRGRIGVVIQDVSRDIANSFGLKEPAGALVSSVDPDGPAVPAGIKVGDVILAFDGTPVADSTQLPRIVGVARPGSRAVLQVFRSGATRDVPIVVGEFAAEEEEAAPAPVVAQVPPRGTNRLGLVTQDLSASQRREFKVNGGAVIKQSYGVAARAELRQGDVVTAVVARGKTEEVRSSEHFNTLVNAFEAGISVSLRVQRGDAVNFVGMKVSGVARK
ncbi:Do family serine endopeptidase [Uliginosibacterium sp. H3]|uniref:Probable periplasmic serine endoprotease DegP-like n=1 Tax=Uliginosibacterium silvisoli TaxID=3114758 RepID=A0ABU6K953_9RHOO|nr:Do family serine endopeptidase [Uliginosibacterium sp. H3]